VSESRARLYCRAAVRARADSPSVAALEAEGWTLEHVDPRWGSALCMKVDEEPARAGDDEAAEEGRTA
jgi:hypothetical protein